MMKLSKDLHRIWCDNYGDESAIEKMKNRIDSDSKWSKVCDEFIASFNYYYDQSQDKDFNRIFEDSRNALKPILHESKLTFEDENHSADLTNRTLTACGLIAAYFLREETGNLPSITAVDLALLECPNVPSPRLVPSWALPSTGHTYQP